MAEKSDMEKAVEGGAEFIAAQQAHVAEVAAAEEARRQAAEASATYPREFEPHTRWVDATNGHEFIGTQYSFNTEAEALAKIDETRAANKFVMYADPDKGSYVIHDGGDDYRVIVED